MLCILTGVYSLLKFLNNPNINPKDCTILTHIIIASILWGSVNSAESDQTPQNVASDHVLCRLVTVLIYTFKMNDNVNDHQTAH